MTPGVRPLIAGNWKMHGLRADGLALARAVAEGAERAGGAELLVCPPFTLLREVAAALEGGAVAVGAQDCHAGGQGRAHRRRFGAHAARRRRPLRHPRPLRAPRRPWGKRRRGARQGGSRDRGRPRAHRLRRREREGAPGRPSGGGGDAPARRQPARRVRGGVRRAAYEPVWAIGTGRTPTEPTSPPSTPPSEPSSARASARPAASSASSTAAR